jgi:LPS-assembly protein
MLPHSAAAQATSGATQIPPPAVPPSSLPLHTWNIVGEVETVGPIRRVRRSKEKQAEIESSTMLFRADEIEYNEDTGDLRAEGNVYYKNFVKNEQLWCSRLEYNTDAEKGKFWDVRGETMPRIVARRGVLTGSEPFHFEGQWAERISEKYIVHNGWVTNCKLPDPWWRLRGAKFDIIPQDRAISHRSWFLVRRMPLFYTPFFYHSLERHPRKSGFLIPNLAPHTIRGFMFGIGYYWAINRDADVTYRFQDYTTQAYAHHVTFRAKPREGSDFGAIIYGVQDNGSPGTTGPQSQFSGLDVYAVGRTELGDGWSARGYFNYLTTFRFRQEWSQSYNETIGSEIHSVGAVTKNWDTYTFNAVAARIQNFVSSEIAVTQPNGNTTFLSNDVVIRKLPDFEFTGRDHQFWQNIPLWWSFDTSAGGLSRGDPIFNQNYNLFYQFQTSAFTQRVNAAPRLTSSLHLGDFHIVPSFGFQETFYSEGQTQIQAFQPLQFISPGELINQVSGTKFVRGARELSVDFIFPSLSRVFNKKTIFGDKLKHVIEPRATYKYVTGIGDDFNRVIRFDEMDILSNTNQLNLSLTNRIYAKRGDSVREILTWQLMQARYFDPTFGGALISGERNVFAGTADITAYAFLVGPRSSSPIASILRASPINGVGIQWQADYDPHYSRIVNSDLSIDYRWSPKYHISVGHDEVQSPYIYFLNGSLVRPSADQFRARFDYGDANRRGLNIGAETVYDYREAVLRYVTAQATYNTDCCGLSVEYREYSTGIGVVPQFRIAFSIANLGTFGTLRKQDRLF